MEINRINLIMLAVLFVISTKLSAEDFNTNELIVASGKGIELTADEGYLLVALNTDHQLTTISFKSTELFSKKLKFRRVRQGVNWALVKLKAGQYYLSNVHAYDPQVEYKTSFEKDQHAFEVKPGVINYPGTWMVYYERINDYFFRLWVDVRNEMSNAYPHFLSHFKSKIPPTEFEYHNRVKDSYVGYLNQLLKHQTEVKDDELGFNFNYAQHLPFTVIANEVDMDQYEQKYPSLRTYLTSQTQLSGGINQQGTYFLFSTKVDDTTVIGVANTKTFEFKFLLNEQLPEDSYVDRLQWIDDDSIHYKLVYDNQSVNFIAHLKHAENGQLNGVKHLKIPRHGSVVSPMKGFDDLLYFASWNGRTAHRSLQLFQVNVADEKSIKKTLKKPYKQVKKLKNVIDYLSKDGVIRAAITTSYDKKSEQRLYHYWFLKDQNSKDWEQIHTLTEDEDPFMLSGLSADESFFYVITDRYGDKPAIHQFATSNLAHLGLIYQDDQFEIKRLITDGEGRLIGYGYYDQGVYQLKYFDQKDDRLAAVNNNDINYLTYVSQFVENSNQLLIYGVSPTTKGSWYIMDLKDDTVNKVFDTNPDYEQLPKGVYHHITATAADGLNIEGFLVLPKNTNTEKVPLVVIPHGGPIGIRDYAYNDSVQQFFAAQGIATLKVNYRGSGGYGKKFVDEGKGQWGEKIEQDIHTVMQAALKKHPIDPNKICAMGGSYGGYSAVMLTVLYPNSYQCAVSWAGVMDLPLVFANTLYNHDEKTYSEMASIIGNPDTEHEKLKQKSPLYLSERLAKPLLLLQGMEDIKVEYEHAMRMQQVALLTGLDFELVLFENEGHSFSSVEAQIQHVARGIEFIKKHLEIQ